MMMQLIDLWYKCKISECEWEGCEKPNRERECEREKESVRERKREIHLDS